MKPLILLTLLLLCGCSEHAFADEISMEKGTIYFPDEVPHYTQMKVVSITEVPDCPYPSTRVPHIDSNGILHAIIQQDPRC